MAQESELMKLVRAWSDAESAHSQARSAECEASNRAREARGAVARYVLGGDTYDRKVVYRARLDGDEGYLVEVKPSESGGHNDHSVKWATARPSWARGGR